MNPILKAEVYPDLTKLDFLNGEIKNVKTGDFLNCLKDNKFRTPVLPVGTVFYQETAPNDFILIKAYEFTEWLSLKVFDHRNEHPSDAVTYNFFVPWLYFIYKITKEENYIITKHYLYISFKRPSDNTKLYRPNMPNVYNDCVICWGDNNIDFGNIQSLNDLANHEYLFINGFHTKELCTWNRLFREDGEIYNTEREWASSGLVSNSVGEKITEIIGERF